MLQKGYRKVLDVYPSDETGNRKQIGEFVSLDLEINPQDPLNSELAYIHPLNHYARSDFRITQTKSIAALKSLITGLEYTTCAATYREHTQHWTNKTSSHPELPLHYGFYKPGIKHKSQPLIIWLHGAGEGGLDPTLAYTGLSLIHI